MALATDSHLAVVPLFDETPASWVISHEIDTFDHGQVAAELEAPANNEVRRISLTSISENAEDLFADNNLRAILNYFYAGGQLRAYRLYPSVVDIWSRTNPYGYSDIVSDGSDKGAYNWYNSGMTRFKFELEGLEVG